MDSSRQQLLWSTMFLAFFHHVQVQRVLHKFSFHNLIFHFNIGAPLVRLNIHSANTSKNYLVVSIIVHGIQLISM